MMRGLLLICLAAGLIHQSVQKCNVTEDQVFILHGEYLKPAQFLPITICNATDIIENQPIKMEPYEDYFRIVGSPRDSLNKEKLPILYSNSFNEMPNLKTIEITMVELEEVELQAFKGLTKLRYLNLSKNKLTNLNPEIFSDLSELRILNLAENKLNGVVSHQFQHLINLKDLHLNMNEIDNLPEFWQTGLSKLEYLNLGYNQISVLRSEMFHGLINLDRLRLHSNRINVMEKDAFKGLLKLVSLTMEFNSQIEGDILHELKNLPELTGIAMTPYSFYCDQYLPAMEYLEEKNVEVVEIPYSAKCLKHQNSEFV